MAGEDNTMTTLKLDGQNTLNIPGLNQVTPDSLPTEGREVSLLVEVLTVTYYKPTNGYSVVKCGIVQHDMAQGIPKALISRNHETYPVVTIVGNTPGELPVGLNVEVKGVMAKSPKHGWQIQGNSWQPVKPSGKTGAIAYLLLLKGIGKKTAQKIVDHFGAKEVYNILDETPEDLLEINGISKNKLDQIIEDHVIRREARQAIETFIPFGFSDNMLAKIIQSFGSAEKAIATVKRNPYELIRRVKGIGWSKADNFALRANPGLFNKPERYAPAITQAVSDIVGRSGGTRIEKALVLQKTNDLLLSGIRSVDPTDHEDSVMRIAEYFMEEDRELSKEDATEMSKQSWEKAYRGYHPKPDDVEQTLVDMEESGRVYQFDVDGVEQVANPTDIMYAHEIIKMCRGIMRTSPPLVPANDVEANIIRAEKQTGLTLMEEQREAVRMACKYPIWVITGGPGTGKTTVCKVIVQIMKNNGRSVAPCALSATAAKRAQNAMGIPAQTIHRLLKFSPQFGGFTHDETNPLSADLVIGDESSMTPVSLAYSLFTAIKNGGCIGLIGDKDQLPSIGPGALLRDFLAWDEIPYVYLQQIHRQAADSRITQAAIRINRGGKGHGNQRKGVFAVNDPNTPPKHDFAFYHCDDKTKIAGLVVAEIDKFLKAGHPLSDIQVLTRAKGSDVGVHKINEAVQSHFIYKSPAQSIDIKYNTANGIVAKRFNVGDRVMQTQNEYNQDDLSLSIYNGTHGKVIAVNKKDESITVDFGYVKKIYQGIEDFSKILVAWAMTIHKSQGSEYPIVIVICHSTDSFHLRKELLYTAVTRAEKHCRIIGNTAGVNSAVRKPIEPRPTLIPLLVSQQLVYEDKSGLRFKMQ